MTPLETTNGPLAHLYIHQRGHAGTPLVLLHGVTRHGGDWDPLVRLLGEERRIVALDQRGHGRSNRAERYLVQDYVTDAIRWLRDDFAVPVVMIGHSLGAMVATAVAAALPQLVRAIVLEDPPFHTMGNRIVGSAWQAQFLGMREAAENGGDLAQLTERLAAIQLPQTNGGYFRLGDVRSRESLAWSAECLQQIDPAVLTPVIAGHWLDGYDAERLFASLTCPTLLLQADSTAGGALTDADVRTIQRTCATCDVRHFPGAGHQLHRDRTQQVADAILAFLAQAQP